MIVFGLSRGHEIGLLSMGGLFILFAILSSFVFPRFNPDFPTKRGLVWYLPLCVCFFLAMMTAVLVFGKESKPATAAAGAGTTTTAASTPASAADIAAGKTVFLSAGCNACHTLKSAGATGTVGPNLDDAKPPASLVIDRVTNGKGAMPSFQGKLSTTQIQDVAAYVSSSAGQ